MTCGGVGTSGSSEGRVVVKSSASVSGLGHSRAGVLRLTSLQYKIGIMMILASNPGAGHGNPLQYSCLENPIDRGAWCATVHRVAMSRT